jgi:hypothetical protein
MAEERSRQQSSDNRRNESSESRDLREREYRDKEGNIHHHTHTAEAMHEGNRREDERENR